MLELRAAKDRGAANFGWLNSKHTFSFGRYYDPTQMGFSALRVINDDEVAPGAGFDTHGHQDMEIISYVLQGAIAHKDSAGNIKTLPAGEFQLMSAGKGIYHSEFNASDSNNLKFLQIWIQPNQFGGTPGYQQKAFERKSGLNLIISPDGRDGSLQMKQDAYLHQLLLEQGQQLALPVQAARRYYLHLISGSLQLGEQQLQPGDGIKLAQFTQLNAEALQGPVEALWFDLP
ncbi:pirin family protein [Rheinheimera sp.]|uniref:pirin family protein n=1 Tax=Rheinheimera sp. TaxID=1869214 RepID=UPI00307CF855